MKKRRIIATVSALALTGALSGHQAYAAIDPFETQVQSILNDAVNLGLLNPQDEQGLLDSITPDDAVGIANSSGGDIEGAYIGPTFWSVEYLYRPDYVHYENIFEFFNGNGASVQVYGAPGTIFSERSTTFFGGRYFIFDTSTPQPFLFVVRGAYTDPEMIPTTTVNLSGNQGSNGWYDGPVQVSLSGFGDAETYYSTDNGTTWQTYSGPLSFTSDGEHNIEYYSVDKAGTDEAPKTVSFNIDQTPPSTQSSVSGKQGNNGWYVGPVQLSLSANDNLSGVATTYYSTDGGSTWQTYTNPVSFSSDEKYNVEYYSVDNAGNKETPQSVSFNIDQTPPTINVSSPVSGTYLDDASPTVTYSVNDNMSGVSNSSITSTFDGQSITNGTAIPLYTLSLGVHTLTVSAADNAGNTATQSITFQVSTSVDSLKNLISLFTNNGVIDNAGVSNALTAKLDSGSLQAFVNQVEAQSGKHISATVAQYLLRDAKYLLGQ